MIRTTAGAALFVALFAVPALADKKLDDAVAKAEEQVQKGRQEEALKGLQKFAQGNPSTEAWLALARLQEKLGNLEEAAKTLATAAEQATGPAKSEVLAAQSAMDLLVATGKDALAHAEQAVAAQAGPAALAALARAQVRAGDGAALQSAEKALAAGPNNALAAEAHGEALLAAGKKDEAVAAYRRALQLDPKLTRARLGLAAALSASGKHAEAVSEARKATEADPKSAEAFATLGLALLAENSGNWNGAIAEAQQGAFLNQKSVAAQIAVGQIFEAAGNLDQAAAAYERASQLDPGLLSLRLRTLNMKYPIGRVQQKYREAKEKGGNGGLDLGPQVLARDEGYQALRKLAAEQPKNGELAYQMGLYQLYVEDYKGAAAALKKATELAPGLPQAWAYLGTAEQYNGRTSEAVAAYKKAVELDPSNIPFRSTYGLLLGVNGEYEPGVAQLVRVTTSKDYKDSAGFTNLGWLYRNMTPKKTHEAVAAYKRALELDAKNAQAALGMGWAYSYQKDYDAAIAAFQKATAIDASVTSEAMNGAAWCYFFKQDMPQAQAHLDKAQAAGRSDPRLRENIAKMEKLKEQRAAYEEALRKAAEERERGPDIGTLSRQAMAGDAGSKIRAIRALGDAGRDGIPALIRALDDGTAAVREAAAEELGGMGPAAKQAVPYLMEVLRADCGKTIMEKKELEESLKCEDAKRKARDAVQKINR